MDYRIQRNIRGNWEARSDIPLAGNQVLEVCTCKRSNGKLTTIATVVRVGNGFREHTVFQDFCKTIAVSDAARITESAVRNLHTGALANIQPVLDAVAQHYADADDDADDDAAPSSGRRVTTVLI